MLLFSILINDPDDGTERILSKFTVDAKLGGAADNVRGSFCHPEGLDRLERCVERDIVRFSKKCRVLPLGRNNPGHQHTPGLS